MSKARELANLGNAYSDGALSNRNLIINGSFIVNQRNADTAVASGTGWPCDRWNVADNQSGLTQQRNGGSYTKPDGFKNYLRSIVTTATTKGAGDYAVIYQPIEAYNIQQLNWGTSAANKATLSFVSRSNVTGTFGGAIQNHDGSMCYPFTYTVTSADTWEEQVVVIDGATTGAWNHDNGRGITVLWGLGVGSTYSNTAGVWTTSYTFTATGAVDITGALNNYLAITGVQLEIGDTATPFEHRSYGQELPLCQRYFLMWRPEGTGTTNFPGVGFGYVANATSHIIGIKTPVTLRATPTVSFTGALTLTSGGSGAGYLSSVAAVYQPGPNMFWINCSNTAGTATNGYGSFLYPQNSTANSFSASAEL